MSMEEIELFKKIIKSKHDIALKVGSHILGMKYHPTTGYHPAFYSFEPALKRSIINDNELVGWIFSAKGCEAIMEALVERGFKFELANDGTAWRTEIKKGHPDDLAEGEVYYDHRWIHKYDWVKTVIFAALGLVIKEELECLKNTKE